MQFVRVLAVSLLLLAAAAPVGVVGVQNDMLNAAYWVARAPAPNAVILTPAQIAAANTRLYTLDASTYDLKTLGATLSRAQITAWITKLSKLPKHPLLDAQNNPIPAATLQIITANTALNAIPAQTPTRYGLAIRRAALRTFPTPLRVFTEKDNQDIDRFQESALFPGEPVIIAHTSADGKFLFVVSPRYAAWADRTAIAEGSASQVLSYPDGHVHFESVLPDGRTVTENSHVTIAKP